MFVDTAVSLKFIALAINKFLPSSDVKLSAIFKIQIEKASVKSDVIDERYPIVQSIFQSHLAFLPGNTPLEIFPDVGVEI